MSRATINTGGVSFGSKPGPGAIPPVEGGPLHIALLGDFSGRANNRRLDPGGIAARRAIEIDRDNFEEVFTRLDVTLDLPVAEEPITFGEFDDLHPDYLYERLPLFAELRGLKRRLQKPAHFERAAAQIRAWREEAAPAPEDAAGGDEVPPSGVPLPDGLLDSVLSESAAAGGEHAQAEGIQRLIRDIVAPHVVPKADPELSELTETVDQATCDLMRRLCHASAFQQLEASWRAVYLLVRRLETDSQLKLYLVDVAREELEQDLAACGDDLAASGLYKLLVEPAGVPGATPFGVINADYSLGSQPGDTLLAAGLAGIGESLGAAVCAGGATALAGCPDISRTADPSDWNLEPEQAQAWEALRGAPECAHLALAAPRFLLRLPYGRKTSPIESFDYEELPKNGEHRYYLWGNSAYLATLLLAESYARAGWDFSPGQLQQVDDFPLHVYTDADGDEAIKPCAEVMLTDKGAGRLMEAGLLPVRSVKNAADIQLPQFSSLRAGATLAGRWRG